VEHANNRLQVTESFQRKSTPEVIPNAIYIRADPILLPHRPPHSISFDSTAWLPPWPVDISLSISKGFAEKEEQREEEVKRARIPPIASCCAPQAA